MRKSGNAVADYHKQKRVRDQICRSPKLLLLSKVTHIKMKKPFRKSICKIYTSHIYRYILEIITKITTKQRCLKKKKLQQTLPKDNTGVVSGQMKMCSTSSLGKFKFRQQVNIIIQCQMGLKQKQPAVPRAGKDSGQLELTSCGLQPENISGQFHLEVNKC